MIKLSNNESQNLKFTGFRSAFIIVLCMLLMLSFTPLTAYADDGTKPLNEVGLKSLDLYCSGERVRSVTITDDGQLTFFFPESLDYMRMELENRQPGEITETAHTDTSITYDVSELPEGESEVVIIYWNPEEIFEDGSSKRTAQFSSLVTILKSDGIFYIAKPKYYDKALDFHNSEVTDEEILNMYLGQDYSNSDKKLINKYAKKITSGLETDYEKCLAIHDWVSENIYYDFDALEGRKSRRDQSAAAVLKSRLAVCQGYATLTGALLRAVGIPSKYITGEIPSQGSHGWVEAYVDDHWLIMDPTWDSSNSSANGEMIKGDYDHDYFDITWQYLALDHITQYSTGVNMADLQGYIEETQKIRISSLTCKKSGGKYKVTLKWKEEGSLKPYEYRIFRVGPNTYNCKEYTISKGKHSYNNSSGLKKGKRYYYKLSAMYVIDGWGYIVDAKKKSIVIK